MLNILTHGEGNIILGILAYLEYLKDSKTENKPVKKRKSYENNGHEIIT